MATRTIAKTTAWCLNCPNTIQPGDQVLIGPEYAKPGTDAQPQIHAACEGQPEYDPDAEQWNDPEDDWPVIVTITPPESYL